MPSVGRLDPAYKCWATLRPTDTKTIHSPQLPSYPMSTIINTDLTRDLWGLVAPFRVQPCSVPENLTAMIGWAVMGSHYLVSGCLSLVFGAMLTVGMQQSVMRWEAAEGGLPSYVNEYARQLLPTQAWIDQGGPNPTTNVGSNAPASTTTGPQPPT